MASLQLHCEAIYETTWTDDGTPYTFHSEKVAKAVKGVGVAHDIKTKVPQLFPQLSISSCEFSAWT